MTFSQALLLTVTLFCSFPALSQDPRLGNDLRAVVSQVYCQSGAPVNFAETFKLGSVIPMSQAYYEELVNKHGSAQQMFISGRGAEYQSGRGPCPEGDALIIEFEIPPRS